MQGSKQEHAELVLNNITQMFTPHYDRALEVIYGDEKIQGTDLNMLMHALTIATNYYMIHNNLYDGIDGESIH